MTRVARWMERLIQRQRGRVLVDDHRPLPLRHSQGIRACGRLARQAFAVADLVHGPTRAPQGSGDPPDAPPVGQAPTGQNRPIFAGSAAPRLGPEDAQQHLAQARNSAPAGGPNGTKSRESIIAKSGGSNHFKSLLLAGM